MYFFAADFICSTEKCSKTSFANFLSDMIDTMDRFLIGLGPLLLVLSLSFNLFLLYILQRNLNIIIIQYCFNKNTSNLKFCEKIIVKNVYFIKKTSRFFISIFEFI